MNYNEHRAALMLTYDHEMTTNFPYQNSVWDHRKGDIDLETSDYVAGELAIASEYGVQLTYFLVASALERNDIGYLQEAVRAGHEVGNHTYSHVNVTAKHRNELHGAYSTRPHLIGQRHPHQVIQDEIDIANQLIQQKLGVTPTGFRTPYGFVDGLESQTWLRQFLLGRGFRYVSSRYYGWDLWDEGFAEDGISDSRLLADLRQAQPYRYADGLIELPITTPSDCHVFRPWRWSIQRWIAVIRKLIDLSYEHGLVLDLCCHPSILAARDPDHLTLTTAITHARSKMDGIWITTPSELIAFQNQQVAAPPGRLGSAQTGGRPAK